VACAGLQALVKKAKDPREDLEKVKSIVLSVPVIKGRRSSVDIIDVKTGKSAEAVLPDTPRMQQQHVPQSGDKMMYREVAENFANMRHKLAKYKDQLSDYVFTQHPSYSNMMNIVKRVEESVAKVQEWFQNGEYGMCDDEIWRAGVDLESLKNMMVAIGQSY